MFSRYHIPYLLSLRKQYEPVRCCSRTRRGHMPTQQRSSNAVKQPHAKLMHLSDGRAADRGPTDRSQTETEQRDTTAIGGDRGWDGKKRRLRNRHPELSPSACRQGKGAASAHCSPQTSAHTLNCQGSRPGMEMGTVGRWTDGPDTG
jgi:hypothetical protein